MSDLISRSALIEELDYYISHTNETSDEHYAYKQAKRLVEKQPSVEPVRGEWIYWKEQCEYCMNRNTCPYPENQESMEALKQWEKENKFWGSLKLICDYYVLDKDKYYLDNPPECNAEG